MDILAMLTSKLPDANRNRRCYRDCQEAVDWRKWRPGQKVDADDS